jgi:hypothetical protein
MRLFSLVNSQEILRENVQKVAKCREEIEAAYGKMFKEMEEGKEKLMRKLDEMQAELTILIDKAVCETSLHAYKEDYTPSGGLVELLWRNCCENSSEPITTFTYEVGNTDNRLLNPLEIRIQASVFELVNWQYESGGASLIKELKTTRHQLLQSNSSPTAIQKPSSSLSLLLPTKIQQSPITGLTIPQITLGLAMFLGKVSYGLFIQKYGVNLPSEFPQPAPSKSDLELPFKFGLFPPAKVEELPVIASPKLKEDPPLLPHKEREELESGSSQFSHKLCIFPPGKAGELPKFGSNGFLVPSDGRDLKRSQLLGGNLTEEVELPIEGKEGEPGESESSAESG